LHEHTIVVFSELLAVSAADLEALPDEGIV
jgi:hypothetical protein